MFFPTTQSNNAPIRCGAPLEDHVVIHTEGDMVMLASGVVNDKTKASFYCYRKVCPTDFDTKRIAIAEANMHGPIDLSRVMSVRAFDIARVFGMLLDSEGEMLFFASVIGEDRDLLVGPCDAGRFVPVNRADVSGRRFVVIHGNCNFTPSKMPLRLPPVEWLPTDPEMAVARASIGIAVFDKKGFATLVADYMWHDGPEPWSAETNDGSIIKVDDHNRMISSSNANPADYVWVPAIGGRE